MKSALCLCVCLLLIAGVSSASKFDASKKADEIMMPVTDPSRVYFEGFESGVPPSGWTAVVTNPLYTWEVGTYNPLEGIQYATCFYDPALTFQDEWLCFEYTLEADDDVLSWYAFGSTYWAVSPYQNYNLIVTINGAEVWNYRDDNDGAVTWAWQQYSADLTSYGVGSTIEVCFGYVGVDGAQGAFDAIYIGESTWPPQCCPFDYTCYEIDFNDPASETAWYPIDCGLGPIPWQWGVPVGVPTLACDDVPVTNVLATVLAGNYPISRGQGAVIGPFDLTPLCSCLELCHYYDIESGFDGGNVKISLDGGATWILVYPDLGYDDILDSTSYIAECTWGEQVFCGHLTAFRRDCFDLTDYVGNTILVGFFFGADSSVTYPGWYIKWVKIGGDEYSPTEKTSWGFIKALYR